MSATVMERKPRFKYSLQVLGTAGAPQLSHTIELGTRNDVYVADQARTMAEAFAGVRWFMGVRVWLNDEEVIGEAKLPPEPVGLFVRTGNFTTRAS